MHAVVIGSTLYAGVYSFICLGHVPSFSQTDKAAIFYTAENMLVGTVGSYILILSFYIALFTGWAILSLFCYSLMV